ncbi:MAG: major facilitator superfamily 1 [Firmicutes bacterium]|nr:major facilitator superfamily 1 [Bacillota bacterium]
MSQNDRLTKNHWLSLAGATAGWTLDAMDWMMLALALPMIKISFDCTLPQLGLLATFTLGGAALGGVIVGILADYYGRVRVLMFTMLWYSIFTGICGFAQSYDQLLALRFITGFGLGGEWAVGAALVSEYWPDRHRAKATGFVHSGWPLGYGIASVVFMYVAPLWGWRALFWVGVIPALLAILVRLFVPEPEAWVEAKKNRTANGAEKAPAKFPLTTLFTGGLCKITLLGMVLSSGALMAYWGSATWLPSFLANTKGLNIVKTGGFLITLNVGAFLGYQFFGWLADKRGRRLAFISGMVCAIITTIIYVTINNDLALLFFGPVFGFTTYGFFGIFGAYISELFPTEARATGTSLVWNVGRVMSMLSPYIIGALAESSGMALGLGITVVFNLLGLIAVYNLPETVKAGVKLYNRSSTEVGRI